MWLTVLCPTATLHWGFRNVSTLLFGPLAHAAQHENVLHNVKAARSNQWLVHCQCPNAIWMNIHPPTRHHCLSVCLYQSWSKCMDHRLTKLSDLQSSSNLIWKASMDISCMIPLLAETSSAWLIRRLSAARPSPWPSTAAHPSLGGLKKRRPRS